MSTLRPEPAARRRPTDQGDVRRHNAALVLGTVVGHGPLSRARVAARTGLTRATAGSIVDELIEVGLLTERGPAATSGRAGRPGTDVAIDPDGAAGIGLEVTVDGLTLVVVDLEGEVRHRMTRPGDQSSRPAPAVLRSAARLVDDALAACDSLGLPVHGIGVAVPGLVDLGEQVVRRAPNLGWRDVPVVQRLRAHATRDWPDVTLDNEANLAALGELWSGEHSGADSFVLVNGDVGVGAGVVLDGRLHRGSRGFGGELGHLTVAPDGPECRCGARGCLEQVAGLDWILRQAGVPHTADADPVAALVRALESGDRRATDAVTTAGEALGVGVAAMVTLFDVDTVVLGGAFAPLLPWLAEPVDAVLRRRVMSAPWAPVTVRAAALGRDAAVVGAARTPLQALLADPLAAST